MANAIQRIISDLDSRDASARTGAIQALGRDLAEARQAAVVLVRATADVDESVRASAVAVLEKLGPAGADELDQLAGLLRDSREDVAYWAATLIGRSGEVACGASQALGQALGHPSIAVQQQAAWALGQLGSSAASALPALRAAATSSDPRLARLAQQATEKIEG